MIALLVRFACGGLSAAQLEIFQSLQIKLVGTVGEVWSQ